MCNDKVEGCESKVNGVAPLSAGEVFTVGELKMPPRRVAFELDEDDYRSVQEAMRKRAAFSGPMPEGDSCFAGALIGEICRGWMEYHEKWEPSAVDAAAR